MSLRGQHTYNEIISQPASWAEALEAGRAAVARLERLWREAAADTILFTGCGSTYYLALAAAAMAREAGLAARALPASEIWLFPPLAGDLSRTLLVAVSRSGETSETVHALQVFRQAGGKAAVAVTCYSESAVASRCDLTLAVPSAQERSVAQTRSFASMLVLCQALVGVLAGDGDLEPRLRGLPALGQRLLDSYGDLAADLGSQLWLERFFFLGNGPLYGIASEAMLKMKEMSLSTSEAYHMLEFRHGPKSVVNEVSLVIGLVSDGARAQEAAVLAEMKNLGARTLVLAEDGDLATLGTPHHAVRLQSGLQPADRLVLYLPVLQLMAFHRAVAKGLNPDQPRNLTAVVSL